MSDPNSTTKTAINSHPFTCCSECKEPMETRPYNLRPGVAAQCMNSECPVDEIPDEDLGSEWWDDEFWDSYGDGVYGSEPMTEPADPYTLVALKNSPHIPCSECQEPMTREKSILPHGAIAICPTCGCQIRGEDFD